MRGPKRSTSVSLTQILPSRSPPFPAHSSILILTHPSSCPPLISPRTNLFPNLMNVSRRLSNFTRRVNLREATDLLKIAASQNHPLGLFLLGISLRHGWGCEVDPLLAFQCLQHSAESAIVDLNTIKSTDCSAAKHELTIAIHELGICFRHGWGVSRNKETAAYYFELAADLGDPDSQNELGHCYLYGEGVKKDRFRAAHYFRLAHAQGVGQVGNSWIFKEKYDPPLSNR
ncbi:hypothetical protein L0F63_001261 [Massospora cicadina]|nr:hypothetical protein L0F63_001261 [Massospora cicadina]